ERRGTLADRRAVGVHPRLVDAVLAHDVLAGILACGRHLRVQFERLQVDVRAHRAVELRQRLLQAGEPDRAPRTGDVGDEIDAERGGGGHGRSRAGSDAPDVEAAARISIARCKRRSLASNDPSRTSPLVPLVPSSGPDRIAPGQNCGRLGRAKPDGPDCRLPGFLVAVMSQTGGGHMFYRRPTGFARSKATAFCSVRRLAMVMAVLLAGSGQAQAAASHYSLFAQFPPANGAGTAIRGPQVIILGSDGLIYGMSTAGGYYGVGGFFSVRPNGIADSQIDYGSTADSSIGGMLPPSLPANNFTPFALMPNGSILSVTNTGGYYGSAFGTPSGVLYAYMGNGAYGKFHTFYRSTGEVTQPQSIAVGSDGSAYGLALGGTWSGGTLTSNSNLFRFAPVSWNGVVTNLFSFQDYSPTNFVLGTNDNMYVTLPKGV